MVSSCLLSPTETDMFIHTFPIIVLDGWDRSGSYISAPLVTCMWCWWLLRTCAWRVWRLMTVCNVHFTLKQHMVMTFQLGPWAGAYSLWNRCQDMCIDWFNALLVRLDWPFLPAYLDFTILSFLSHLLPTSFLAHFVILSLSFPTSFDQILWPSCFVPLPYSRGSSPCLMSSSNLHKCHPSFPKCLLIK